VRAIESAKFRKFCKWT